MNLVSLVNLLRTQYADFIIGFESDGSSAPLIHRVNKPVLMYNSGFFRSYFNYEDKLYAPKPPATTTAPGTVVVPDRPERPKHIFFPKNHIVTPRIFDDIIKSWYGVTIPIKSLIIPEKVVRDELNRACKYLCCDVPEITFDQIFIVPSEDADFFDYNRETKLLWVGADSYQVDATSSKPLNKSIIDSLNSFLHTSSVVAIPPLISEIRFCNGGEYIRLVLFYDKNYMIKVDRGSAMTETLIALLSEELIDLESRTRIQSLWEIQNMNIAELIVAPMQ
jgi:hypothetical protein